jgi:hypothetical protein
MDQDETKDARRKPVAIQHLLEAWLAANILQFGFIAWLHYLERRRRRFREVAESSASADHDTSSLKPPRSRSFSRSRHWDVGAAASIPVGDAVAELRQPLLPPVTSRGGDHHDGPSRREVRRGKIFSAVGGGLIVFAWVLFMTTAWLRLRSKSERGSS